MKNLDVLSWVLLIVGGLNWGLVGLFEFDLVAAIGGGIDTILSRLIYGLVGLAAVYQVVAVWTMAERWQLPSMPNNMRDIGSATRRAA